MTTLTHIADKTATRCEKCGLVFPELIPSALAADIKITAGARVGVIQGLSTGDSSYIITGDHDCNKPCV